MGKRLAINIGLLLVIAVLVLIIRSDEPTPPATTRLTTINKDNITRIGVNRANQTPLKFTKTVDSWLLQSPMQFRANLTRINAMLSLLETASFGSFDKATVKLDGFELNAPQVTLQLNDHEFAFGTTDAIDQRRYVLFNDKIHMIDDFLFQQLLTEPPFFADLSLVPKGETIKSIQFPDNRIEKQDDQWQMQKLMDIKPQQIKELAYAWETANAVSANILQETQTDLAIIIETEHNATLHFDIIATVPHLILGRKDLGIQYNIGSDVSARLLLQENPPVANEADAATDFFISD